MSRKRIIIGITGATGSVYAVKILKTLRTRGDIETHLVISSSGMMNINHELDMNAQDVSKFSDYYYNFRQIGAKIASGSFETDGMIIAPCSMKTLASIAHGFSDNLITRAADVTLKERKRLLLMIRETPFNLAHLNNMIAITNMGGIIFPPLPAFYHYPKSIDDIVEDSVVRILSLMNLDENIDKKEWQGI